MAIDWKPNRASHHHAHDSGAAIFMASRAQAADSYIALSRAAVLATVSPDLLDTTKLDPRPFAKCFRAQGLTEPKGRNQSWCTGAARKALLRQAHWFVAHMVLYLSIALSFLERNRAAYCARLAGQGLPLPSVPLRPVWVPLQKGPTPICSPCWRLPELNLITRLVISRFSTVRLT